MQLRHVLSLVALLAAASALAQVSDPVVASRGKAVVHLSEVDAKVGQLPAEVRGGYMDNPERIEQLVQSLLLDKQLAAEALELGLHEQPLFEQELALARDGILARRRTQQFIEGLEVPDFEPLARESYLGGTDKFTRPERLEVQHILVRAIGRTEEAAEEIANKVHALAVSGEVPFDDLVAEYNEELDRSGKPTDGKLRVQRGTMVGEFEEAAFALTEPGSISPVVKTIYGWHVIRLLERVPAQVRPYEAVREQIIAGLHKDYVDRAQKLHISDLRSLPLSADEAVVASLRTRYLGDGAQGATGTVGNFPTDGADSANGD